MTLEIFFKNFEQFADAPEAVAKMRELVFSLAAQGRLVAQDFNDEPASRIIERAKASAGGADRLLKTLSMMDKWRLDDPYARHELPDGWAWGCNALLGDTRPRNQADDEALVAFAPMNAIPTDYRTKPSFEARPWAEIKKGYTHVADGDIVVAKITPCFQNGKACVMRELPGGLGAGTTELHVLRPHSKTVDPFYMLLFFKSPEFVRGGVTTFTGTAGQQRVSNDYFKYRPLPLPPLAEQKRIVAKVDELMALCDRLEAQQQERETRHTIIARASLSRFADAPTPANLNFLFHKSYTIPPADLRKSILTLAVQGRLVPQDPNDEPAEDTLAKILRARERQEKSLRIKAPTSVEADADHTPDLPSGWCYASPDQLTAFHKNALTIGPFGSSLLKSDYTDEGVPLVFVRDVRSESFGGPETRFITPDKADELASHTVRPGDLLITKMGDPPGDTAIYPEGRPPAIITADCIKLTPHRDIVSVDYLRFAIRASQIAEQLAGITLGVAQQKVSLGRFRRIAIPVPPLAEQRRIVAKVDELMALVGSLEMQLADERTTASDLLEAVVANLAGIEAKSKLPLETTNSMKLNAARAWKSRPPIQPLKLSTRSFVLRRFKMESSYRSLGPFECNFHLEESGPNEALPICLVGLNGSGKSNLIEAIAEVFCFLELINLPWKRVESVSSRYRENGLRFELEYTLQDAKGEHLVRIRKLKKRGADFFIVKSDETEEPVAPEREQLLLLPRRIIGYSSGLNETVSHPFLRTKTIYSEEVRDAAPPEGVGSSEGDTVFDTRTLYMDYESNAAILICNFVFRKQSELAVIDKFTRVRDVSSFGLHFNRKRAGKSGIHKTVRLTGELHSYLRKFAFCAGGEYDDTLETHDFNFKLTPEVKKRFREEFETAENLFMAMHKWALLNALVLSDEQRKVYLRSDITKGALERPPSVPPSDRIFDIVDLKLNLSIPQIEIDYSGLSDGEHQFIQVFGTAMLFNEPGTLFLFDEPESHFNPEWRTKFNLILNALPNACRQEYVISTHSPYIVSGSRKSNVYKFERDRAEIRFAPVDFETYGASFDVLLKKLFSIDSLIDQSAKEELQEIIKRGKVQEMKAAVGEFAESREKRKLYEAIITKEEKK